MEMHSNQLDAKEKGRQRKDFEQYQKDALRFCYRTVIFVIGWMNFEAIQSGVIDLRDMVFFLSLIAGWLGINAILIDLKRVG